jgi:hypothetical protein
MVLHQRGVDLLINLMDADQHFDSISPDELHRLIREAIAVFGELLKEDNEDEPAGPTSTDQSTRLM